MRFGRVAVLLLTLSASAAPPPANSPAAQAILSHLEHLIAWYRELTTLSPPAVDVLIADDLHATALKAVQLAFTFARSESALLGEQQGTKAAAASGALQQAQIKWADRVTNVQSQISKLDAEIAKAFGKNLDVLVAQRNEMNAELALDKEIQTAVQNLVNFTGAVGSGGGTLASQIQELARSVPEVVGKTPPAPANSKTNTAAAFSPETAGVLSLTSELLSNHSNRSHLSDLLRTTQAVSADIGRLKDPLVNQARDLISRSDQITGQMNTQDPAQLAAAQQQLDNLRNQFKQLSTAILPLGEEGIAVTTAESYLEETIGTLDQETTRTARYLLMKAVTLAIVIFIVLVVGELWRRATFRYVRDARRRRQFLLLRRVVIAIAVCLSIVLWFVSELGSLATYAGFVTAGVAVALQSPILSVVAYFFLIGRYGIRVGDRVTISGVTGEVIEIGLVRIYLAELAGAGGDLHSTGRVVVFSNSVIFQPSALYKQMPGIDYLWHTAQLTLAGDSDFQLAEETLNKGVEAFYAKYRVDLERQYRSLEQSVDMHMTPPKPETRMRFTDAGLQYSVRYPAEIPRAAEMDNQLLLALHEAVAKEPKLKFAEGGTPKLQPV